MSDYLNALHPKRIEGLCDHMQSTLPSTGIELLQAHFAGHAYDTHSHDTYAIGLTDFGVQSFDYRGKTEHSTIDRVMVLHPGEVHNGRAGDKSGFSYRMLYIDPSLISQALQSITQRPCPLPFIKECVLDNQQLTNAINLTVEYATGTNESLAKDEVIYELTRGLAAADPSCISLRKGYSIDFQAIDKAKEFLLENQNRIVSSKELENITDLNRFELTRHFKKVLGCSPYRYLLNRRLDSARVQLHTQSAFIDIAHESGFSDQAHFCRLFKSRFGLTPGTYHRLNRCN